MRCASCGFENPEGTKFCGKCGTPLQRWCSGCGAENPPRFKFCGECGQPLTRQSPASYPPERDEQTDQASPVAPHSTARSTPAAERRHLTVMFCDLVGSTPLSQQLDPEELRTVLLAYQEACAQVIHRFDGYIARYMGDGLLVYFGYPQAHEDDAQRAIRAGIGIMQALPQLNRQVQQTVGTQPPAPLHVRVGIHTGLVVVSEMGGGGHRDPMAIVGETPNVAARLQDIAEPDTVVLSPITYRLVEGFFTCASLGPHALKGISTPVEVYQVLKESGVQSRFEVAVTAGLTPLVGREQEVGLLLERWEQVKEGQGQVVLLSGEAGIGKSRLVQTLKERVAGESYAQMEWRCSPYYQNSAFYPLIEHVQRLLQLHGENAPEEQLKKLEGTLGQYGLSLPAMVPLFAALLSLPLPERYPPLNLSPQRQKQKTMEALLAWLLKEAERQPVRLTMEDLHWADPSTLEFLGLLIAHAPTARLLIVLTFRPDFHPPWPLHAYVTHLTLNRLSRAQTELMVEQVAGGKVLPAEVRQQIVAKTDGVPLFVEELTEMVLESGLLKEHEDRYELAGPLPPLAIPATLHDSLMARLDRLATAKEVAQLGATLGREFPYDLIQAVSPLHEATLQKGLARLVEADLLSQRGFPPQARYTFKHALIQETAYQSLLKSKRQQYHHQIAQILEAQFPESTDTQPELLAYHYSEAGVREKALVYWQKAGHQAMERSAHTEAISHFTKGLDVLKTFPDTPERAQQELALSIALGAPLLTVKGHTAPEVEQTYARARELCRQVGETPQLFQTLLGLVRFYAVRGAFQTAHELSEQCLSLAQNVHDPALLSWAHCFLGETLFHMGELIATREQVEQGIAFYDPQHHRPLASLYGQDPKVGCLYFAALALWLCGYPDQAVQRAQEAIALATELSRPFSLAGALSFAAAVHQFRHEGKAAQELAEAALTLATEHGFPQWLMVATILRGWTLAEQEHTTEGIALMQRGLTAQQASGAEMSRPYFLSLLAEIYCKTGQSTDGLHVVNEALEIVRKNGEHSAEAELYRLKGELSLKSRQAQTSQGKSEVTSPQAEAEAEAYFQKAIALARRQSAKSWELRAVMSLSRLLQQQGRQTEARQMLAEIYGWFTEGFDTADLLAAKMLLAELS